MTKQFILDFETLGTDTSSCPIIDVSYYIFDWNRFTTDPYTFEELISSIIKKKVSVQDQVRTYGFKIEPATVEWWSKQDKKVRDMIKPLDTDLYLHDFMNDLLSYLNTEKIFRWWSRSNTFDPIILYRIAKVLNKTDELNRALAHWNVRDMRTFIDAKFSFQNKTNGFIPMKDGDKWNSMFEQHNSVHDVAADILRLQTITRFENDLEVE